MMKLLRADIAKYIKPMTHCARCRADAVGLLGKDDPEAAKLLTEVANMSVSADETRPHVAVASHEGLLVNQHLGEADFRITSYNVCYTKLLREGLLVNQHLGEADFLYIYKETASGYRMVEKSYNFV